MKLRGLILNSYIHVSVSDLYIPRISLPIWLEQNRQTDPGNIKNCSQIHECGNWETENYNSVLKIMNLDVSFLGIHKSGTRHLYCILTGPSFEVYVKSSP
jgi:hypothetical protein